MFCLLLPGSILFKTFFKFFISISLNQVLEIVPNVKLFLKYEGKRIAFQERQWNIYYISYYRKYLIIGSTRNRFSVREWLISLLYLDSVLGQLPSRKIPLPPTPKLILTRTLSLIMGRFSLGQLSDCPPTLKLTLNFKQTPTLTGGHFSSMGNSPDTDYNYTSLGSLIFTVELERNLA